MYDNMAGTYFVQAREYDSWAGRFTARDIIKGVTENPVTLNEYIYCWNSSLLMVDLNGQWPQWMKDAGDWIEEKVSHVWNNYIYGEREVTVTDNSSASGLAGGYVRNKVSETTRSSGGSIIDYLPEMDKGSKFDNKKLKCKI